MTQLMSVRAVVVGIDDYKDPRLLTRKLKYAATDANDVARAIDQSTVFKVEKLAIFTNVHATHWQVWRSLNEVFPQNLNFDSNTIAIFYFAGHGMKDPIEGERIYLGCNDVEVANPMKGGIPLSNIYNLLLQSSAGCSMAIIDACFSGAIMDLKRIEHESPAELARREIGTLRGADDKTVAIFAACRSEQSAREDDERKHGIYTDELLQGWRDGKARDEEGKVHILDLAAYLTKLFENDEQTPRSNVLSGRSIIIWQHDPPASGTALTLPKPLPPRKLTDVGDRVSIPIAPPEEEPKTWRERLREWAIWIICAAVALFACAFSTVFVGPLRFGFFALIFGLDIIFTLIVIGVNRVIGLLLALVQLPLLAGFAYQYFHWGVGIAPLAPALTFLAGFLWLFWLLFVGELLFLIMLLLEIAMHW
jgi:Caspase domain